ncbi:Protein of uncharacterised function (DUF3307) [Legionella lansingensis]|nr:DUF3307 domain-containing protein [Legionella lansingensis]SNV50223.1 Protein of uncharacterised function (DUF3307) [Legionella lansingensis]
MSIIFLFFLFEVKHLIVDFFFQHSPYIYQNKGIYGHLGGILHALYHIFGSYLILVFSSFFLSYSACWPVLNLSLDLGFLILAILEGIVHYHIDWLKIKINNRMKWQPTSDYQFWDLLGVDQFLHHLTYIVFVLVISKSVFLGAN